MGQSKPLLRNLKSIQHTEFNRFTEVKRFLKPDVVILLVGEIAQCRHSSQDPLLFRFVRRKLHGNHKIGG